MKKELLPKVINVTGYSGYKANERPLYLIIDNSKLTVRRIIKKWIEPEKDCFEALASDNRVYVVTWNRDSDIWYLEKISPYCSDL